MKPTNKNKNEIPPVRKVLLIALFVWAVFLIATFFVPFCTVSFAKDFSEELTFSLNGWNFAFGGSIYGFEVGGKWVFAILLVLPILLLFDTFLCEKIKWGIGWLSAFVLTATQGTTVLLIRYLLMTFAGRYPVFFRFSWGFFLYLFLCGLALFFAFAGLLGNVVEESMHKTTDQNPK